MKAQTYLNICGVPTKVATWGPGLAEVNTSEKVHDIILMIPGNPGYAPFYDEFLQEVHNRRKCSVWIIGHAGHDVPKNFHQIIPPLEGNEALYDTNGQVTSKVSFIEQYVPANARLHLIGHSIGAYIVIQLLKRPSINSRVVGSYLLFPVFERLSETPTGSIFQKLITLPSSIATVFAQIFISLPISIQMLLLDLYGTLAALPKNYRNICREYIHPITIRQMIAMVTSEFVTVRDRDNEILKANIDKIKIYYGTSDGWAPQEYYFQLKSDIPDVDAEICTHNYDHAFVLRHSKEVANLVADWIQMKQL